MASTLRLASHWGTVVRSAGVRSMATTAQAVTFKRFGNPAAVLKADEVVLPDPSGDSVLVRMLAASVSPTDLGAVRGFGETTLPAVAGNEGVGVVEKAGPGVKGLSAGDVVVPARSGLGTWATHTMAPEGALFKVDGSPESLPVEHLASLAAPCAAIAMVDSFAALSKGDVIVQNNAASTVGQAVIQYAASKGIRTVNIMRHRSDWDDVVNHLQGLGAHLVVTDEFASSAEFAGLIADLPAPKLGLSSVGGDAATAVARSLASGATFVTYGNVSREPIYAPLDVLVTKDVAYRGFSLDRHLAGGSDADRSALLSKAVDLTVGGSMKQLLAREPFNDVAVAVSRAQEAGERKVVLTM